MGAVEKERQRNRQPIQLEISDTGSSCDNEVPIPWGRRRARVQVLTERTKNLAVGGKLMAQGLDGGLQVTCGVAGSAGDGFNMSVTEDGCFEYYLSLIKALSQRLHFANAIYMVSNEDFPLRRKAIALTTG